MNNQTVHIQGVEKLQQYLNEEQIVKLQKAAKRHKEQSNTSFSIISLSENTVAIETSQSETSSGKYATETTLVKRTEDLFKKLLPSHKILVTAQPMIPSPANIVDTKWIDQKMQQKGIRIKQIAFDTGIDREDISDWVTGKRSMGQIVKAMFYFYLNK